MKTVFFFAPLPGDSSQRYFQHLSATLPINRKYLGTTILYAPQSAAIPDEHLVDQVVRVSSRHRRYPHFMRVMSWFEHLNSKLFDEDTVFLDADIVLNGSIEGMSLDEALQSVLPTCRMRHRIEDGILRIEPLPPAEETR